MKEYFLKHSCRLVGTKMNENKGWDMSIFRRNVVLVISLRQATLLMAFCTT